MVIRTINFVLFLPAATRNPAVTMHYNTATNSETLFSQRQETQLSLTNRATRLEISEGQQTWYHSICHVWFPITVL